MKQFLKNFARFFYDQTYQESFKWVQWVTEKASVIHHHIWTAERIPAGIMTIMIDYRYGFWLGLLFFLFSALTDWFDGKVKRYRQREGIKGPIDKIITSERFGPVWDGTADKFFIIPIIMYKGWVYCYWLLIVVMVFIEGLGNPYIAYLDSKRKIKKGRNVYEHLVVGKVKFALQVILAAYLWFIPIFPFSFHEVVINFLLSIIVVLAFLSVFCKAKPGTCEKLWHTGNN